MEIEYKVKDGAGLLTIAYGNGEYEIIRDKLESLGLEVAETKLGFGRNLKLNYYRERRESRNVLVNIVAAKARELNQDYSNNYYDDINSSIIASGRTNLAVLRVIPDDDKNIELAMDTFVSAIEIGNFINNFTNAIRAIFDETRAVKANISFVKK